MFREAQLGEALPEVDLRRVFLVAIRLHGKGQNPAAASEAALAGQGQPPASIGPPALTLSQISRLRREMQAPATEADAVTRPDDDAGHTVPGQIRGRRQPHRPATDDRDAVPAGASSATPAGRRKA
jgi:hypothetical protein